MCVFSTCSDLVVLLPFFKKTKFFYRIKEFRVNPSAVQIPTYWSFQYFITGASWALLKVCLAGFLKIYSVHFYWNYHRSFWESSCNRMCLAMTKTRNQVEQGSWNSTPLWGWSTLRDDLLIVIHHPSGNLIPRYGFWFSTLGFQVFAGALQWISAQGFIDESLLHQSYVGEKPC